MEYLWYTLLGRTDSFDSTTPRYLFSQQKVYMKVNGLEEVKEDKKNTTLNRVEDLF